MDVSKELRRLLPPMIQAPIYSDSTKAYIFFLSSISKKEYDEVLERLPSMISRPSILQLPPGAESPQAWQMFVDLVGYHTILTYTRNVPAITIYRRGSVSDKFSLVKKLMSGRAVKDVEQELFQLATNDCLAYLESVFKRDRPGMLDFALEEMLNAIAKKKVDTWVEDPRLSLTDLTHPTKDERILRSIQHIRRKDPKRLPTKITTSYDARFLVEEIHREFYIYVPPDKNKAHELISRVQAWFDQSEFRRAVNRNIQLLGYYSMFFSELYQLNYNIEHGRSVDGPWYTYIRPSFRSERFWHDIAGFNKDIPFEQTQIAQDLAAYRRAAALAAKVYIIVVIAPGLIAGGVVGVTALFEAGASGFLLASQYAYTTYTAFGAIAGTAQIIRATYTYYLQNAVTINQLLVNGAEMVLDITQGGTSLAPGSSPGDMYASAASSTQKLATLTRKGISTLASDAKVASVAVRKANTAVDTVEFLVTAQDGKLYKVVGDIKGFKEGKITAVVKEFAEARGSFDEKSRKALTFYNKEKDVSATLKETRGTNRTATAVDTKPSRAANSTNRRTGNLKDAANSTDDLKLKDAAQKAKLDSVDVNTGNLQSAKQIVGTNQKVASAIQGQLDLGLLTRIKSRLAKSATAVVELGNRVGPKFGKIAGREAIRRLFTGKLSDFSRLEQHWPNKLANQYVNEIEHLIKDGVKDPKLAQEVAQAFTLKKVDSNLLNKLPKDLQGQVKSLVNKRWNYIREVFWRSVYDDKALVVELEKIGMTFAGRGRAPVLDVGGTKIKITLDHIARKVENPLQAFDSQNLRALTSRDNSVQKEGLVRHIKELTGLNLDEFNALGSAAERLPKELAEELGKIIDELPNEDDLFRGLGWPP